MYRRSSMLGAYLALAVVLGIAAQTVAAEAGHLELTTASISTPPDIVVLMLDDTPPIAKLLATGMPATSAFFAGGVRFSHYSGNDPLCCPGRAAFLTGLYSHHHHVTYNDASLFDPRVTLATRLDDAGYHTMLDGKYLNGYEDLANKRPPGWDDLSVMAPAAYYDWDLYRNGIPEHHGRAPADYSTDVLAAEADRMLAEAPAGPLFLMLTPFATHADLGVTCPAWHDDMLRTRAAPTSAARQARPTTRPT